MVDHLVERSCVMTHQLPSRVDPMILLAGYLGRTPCARAERQCHCTARIRRPAIPLNVGLTCFLRSNCGGTEPQNWTLAIFWALTASPHAVSDGAPGRGMADAKDVEGW